MFAAKSAHVTGRVERIPDARCGRGRGLWTECENGRTESDSEYNREGDRVV